TTWAQVSLVSHLPTFFTFAVLDGRTESGYTSYYRHRYYDVIHRGVRHETSRVHADRVTGGDRDHRDSHCPPGTGGCEGARGGGAAAVSEQPEADWAGVS